MGCGSSSPATVVPEPQRAGPAVFPEPTKEAPQEAPASPVALSTPASVYPPSSGTAAAAASPAPAPSVEAAARGASDARFARTASALAAITRHAPGGSARSPLFQQSVELVVAAARQGDLDQLQQLLGDIPDADEKKAIVNTPGKAGGWTALHWAADKGIAEMITLLLDSGADLEMTDNKQWTAVHWAANNGRPQALEILLQRGAATTPLNSDGKTPLELAEAKSLLEGHRAAIRLLGGTPPDLARPQMSFLHCEAALPPLLPPESPEPSADVATAPDSPEVDPADDQAVIAQYDGSLQKAAVAGNVRALKAILADNPSALDSTHSTGAWTALHEASDNGHALAVQFLLDAGADIEMKDRDGRTALHWAVKSGHAAVVELLLDNSADADARTYRNESPADFLKSSRNPEVVGPLLTLERILDGRKRRAERGGKRWAPECAVSLRYLMSFHDELLADKPALTTGDMVATIIKPRTEAKKCRFVDLLDPRDVWDRSRGVPFHFMSHAFGNVFGLVVASLIARFGREGAENVYCWLDVFAINQWDTESDLNGGVTLRDTIALSTDTLVVLDQGGLPLKRLWCLYEISETPKSQLQLIASGFDMLELADLFEVVDVSRAGCFDPKAEKVIRRNIENKVGSEEALTERLKLQLAMLVIRAVREARQRGALVLA